MSFLNLLPLLITAVGTYFLIKLRFFFVLHPIRTVKRLGRTVKDKESRAALSLALAGTLGVGNIVGVAWGISVGGAGALFWIFVSGIFSSAIKYAESSLAADKKIDAAGGMTYVLSSSFGRAGKLLGIIYATLCLSLSLTMGSALQSQSAIFGMREVTDVPEYTVAFIFAAATFAAVLGFGGRIEKATAKIIPLSTVVYIILTLTVILMNISLLPSTLLRVVREASSFHSFGGGVSSFVAIKAMREGYARGLLSNEAGAGTSAMAQTKSGMSSSEVGLLGILEVFFDTTLLCTLTGLAVLLSGADEVGASGMETVLSAVSAFPFGKILLTALIFAFAYSTVICWYYYGCECIRFLFGKRRSASFTAVFIFSVFIGFALPTSLLICASDMLLFFMTLLTLFALIKNSERIVFLSENQGLLKKSDIGEHGESRSLK